MNKKEKTTIPIPSVGADGEQSLSYVTDEIIAIKNEEINPTDENMEEILRQMQRMADPSYLATMTMSQLYDTVYESRVPIIDGLLYPGTYLFVGAPKVGKSFLMAQIAYHVSTGQALWNYPVHAGTVLYLALEDDYRRLQERLSRMFGVEGTDTLHFATCAKQLGANGITIFCLAFFLSKMTEDLWLLEISNIRQKTWTASIACTTTTGGAVLRNMFALGSALKPVL